MEQTQDTLEVKKLKLKVQALLETNQNLTNTIADCRADITLLVEQSEGLQKALGELQEAHNAVLAEKNEADTADDSDTE